MDFLHVQRLEQLMMLEWTFILLLVKLEIEDII